MTAHDNEVPDEREPLDAMTRAALTPDAVRASTRARLLARAAAEAPASGPTRLQDGPAVAWRPSRAIFAGTAVALAASLVLLVRSESRLRNEREAFAAASAKFGKSIDSLGSIVANRDQLLASLTGERVQLVRLAAAKEASPRALMFWDQATHRWTFITHNLPALRAGRTYQLWLVTAKEKISAGTFSVTASGDAVIQATYELDRNALEAVAVTEEPEGGVPVATGPIVVVGAAPKF
jgi:hypothetical protein